MLERLLHSRTAASVLGVVIFGSGLHLREIARRAGVAPADAKRELDNLKSLGVLRCERRGNQSVFYANDACPFLTELKGLYMKTDGVLEALRKALSCLEGIRYVFVYGGIAKEEYDERSDVDLMVVGSIGDEKLSRAVMDVQKLTGREINYILWSEAELKSKLAERSAFISSVVRGKKVWIGGNEHEFAGIAKKRHA